MKNTHAPAVLFLPGFGVGAFHSEKQLRDLGCDYRVWALDFLGQGMSLPHEDLAPSNVEEGRVWGFVEESPPWASKLVYSVDLWRDQVQHFVKQVWLIGYLAKIICNSGTCNWVY
jgi:pimeloyl-ACP methyl ester carboxylesterase